MASGMNSFEKNDNHKKLVCVINRKLHTEVVICLVSIDGVAVQKMAENINVAMTTSKKWSNRPLFLMTLSSQL